MKFDEQRRRMKMVGKVLSERPPPIWTDIASSEPVVEGGWERKAIYYNSVPYEGKATKVFAWIGLPSSSNNSTTADAAGCPGIVLVHGGGGTAFKEWVELWNRRGYAAISMALEGQTDVATGSEDAELYGAGVSKYARHDHSGPARNGIYADSLRGEVKLEDQWMYHALAATIYANTLLRSSDGVDETKVGVLGISWGGIIVSTVLGLDTRWAFTQSAYGCGDLATSENQYGRALKTNQMYKEVWDPMHYVESAPQSTPRLWVSWPQDKHFDMRRQKATYTKAPPGASPSIVLIPGLGHGHHPIWNMNDTYAFADSVVKDGISWFQSASEYKLIGSVTQGEEEEGKDPEGTLVELVVRSSKEVHSASLIHTNGAGFTGTRSWSVSSEDVIVKCVDEKNPSNSTFAFEYSVQAVIPANTTGWFVNMATCDDDNLTASSVYFEGVSSS